MIDWQSVLIECGVKSVTAEKWAPAFSELIKPQFFSTGFKEIDDFLAQILHESGMLEKVEENLNYSSAERLKQVFGSRRFPTVDSALAYVRQPEKLANYVYKNTAGNKYDGDGWKFRGRSPLQITGRDNYRLTGDKIGVELALYPEKLAEPYYGLKAAREWWEGNIPDIMIDNIEQVSRRVNGGINGLDHRRKLFETCSKVMSKYK